MARLTELAACIWDERIWFFRSSNRTRYWTLDKKGAGSPINLTIFQGFWLPRDAWFEDIQAFEPKVDFAQLLNISELQTFVKQGLSSSLV
jgi:hypothetical protein